MYQDNAYKYVALLNRNTPPGRLLNILGHGATALQRIVAGHQALRFSNYIDGDDGRHGEFSEWPYIVLEASSSEKIRKAREQLRTLNLPVVDFSSAMFGISNEDQLAQMRNSKESELEYLGLFTFGSAEELGPIFKRFSLFKCFQPQTTSLNPALPLSEQA